MQGGGISVDVPDGWDAEIYRRIANTSSLAADGSTEQTNAVLHAANFALPADRGDFGSGAVEIMQSNDLLVILFEYNSEDSGKALFENEGLPLPLDPVDFDVNAMQHPLPGLMGLQRFFRSGERAWCLYVVLTAAQLDELVAEANDLLDTIDIEAI